MGSGTSHPCFQNVSCELRQHTTDRSPLSTTHQPALAVIELQQHIHKHGAASKEEQRLYCWTNKRAFAASEVASVL